MVSGSVFFSGEISRNLERAGREPGRRVRVSLGARLAGDTQEAVDDPGRAVAVLAAVLADAGG